MRDTYALIMVPENIELMDASAAQFKTTHWSMVLSAGQGGSAESERALAVLCEMYWYPLYAFVRRHRSSIQDAQDLTQEFFATLIEKNYLQAADRERGKFRTFLITAFKHFLSKERDRAGAQKRGGKVKTISLDLEAGENQYRLEPHHDWTPERIYERRWALTLLERVLARLQVEWERSGKQKRFERLKVFLTGEEGKVPHVQLAEELGMTEVAVKVAVHRLRRRYGELLREEIAQTVDQPEEVDLELDHLLQALRPET